MTRTQKFICFIAPMVVAALATVGVLAGGYFLTDALFYTHPDAAELEQAFHIPSAQIELNKTEYDTDLNYLTLTAHIPDPAAFESALESLGWQRKPAPSSRKTYFTRTENGTPDLSRIFIDYGTAPATLEGIFGCTPKWCQASINIFTDRLTGKE